MLTYLITNLTKALDRGDNCFEIRLNNRLEEEFDSLEEELKEYKYKKLRIKCYPNHFIVRFDLRK